MSHATEGSFEDLTHRFGFHPAVDEDKKMAHGSVRQACLDLALSLNEKLPEGREKAIAIRKLEEVMYWSNAAIARNTPKKKEKS